MKPLRLVMIGLGMVADTHLAALRDTDQGIVLAGVMGRNPERTRAFADKAEAELGHPIAVHATIEEVAQSDADIALVLTPPDARQEIVETLCAAGMPILMEKPVERTLLAATKLVTTCETADVPLGIVFQHRFREASIALKSALDEGRLGTIASVEIRASLWRNQAYYDEPGRGSYARDGGGVMINQAIHTLDLALWLLGPAARLQAMMTQTPVHQMEAEDLSGALLEFTSGVRGVLFATTAAFPGSPEAINVHGTLGSAYLARGTLELKLMDGTTETHGASAATGSGANPMAFTHAWHQSVIEDFASALRDDRPPLCTGRAALRAQAVIDAMTRASQTGLITEVAQP